jgi:tripartite-type tricarboxylate transporter receptor subunit TctC
MRRFLLVVLACLLGVWDGAAAQSWPSKPIRAIIPFGAGSATDVVPRIVLEQLSAQLGQPIVVENRGGAGGTIGSAMVGVRHG